MSPLALDLIEVALGSSTISNTSRAFFHALQPFGVKALHARAHSVNDNVSEDPPPYARISPAGWENLYAERRFRTSNYVQREIRRRALPFAWSDVELQTASEVELSHVVAECGFGDGLAIPCHGPFGYNAVVSLAFSALKHVSPEERSAIEISSLVLHNRLYALATLAKPLHLPRLTQRERDCLAFLAEGRTDNEIALIMRIAPTTVIFHIKNARAKLGAKTRAQAVAHFMLASAYCA